MAFTSPDRSGGSRNAAVVRSAPIPSRPRRRASYAFAAVCSSCLYLLTAGAPALAQDSALSVETVRLTGRTPPDGLHTLGSKVQVWVGFNRDVVVTGRPRVALTIGTETRYAEFGGRSSSEPSWLWFTYVVQASDRDDDGISFPANALTLDGGSITDADGNDANLSHDAVPDNPEHRVDGRVVSPVVVEYIYLRRTGPPDGLHTLGSQVRAYVGFNRDVVVTGRPRVALTIGTKTRYAGFRGRNTSDPSQLWFSYNVQASDRDDDGISIPANALGPHGAPSRAPTATMPTSAMTRSLTTPSTGWMGASLFPPLCRTSTSILAR